MISNSLRTWSSQQGLKPMVMIYQNSQLGVFSISDVEAKVNEELDAVSWLCLSLSDQLGDISRVELSIISGMHESLFHDQLDNLVKQNMLEFCDYDKTKLDSNLERLTKEVGDDWLSPVLKRILNRGLIKQYRITETGKIALKTSKKLVTEAIDMDIAISSKPFHIFLSKLNPRANTYNEIDMTPDLTSKVLSLAKSKQKITGIDPIRLNQSSTTIGREVNNSQIWVSFNSKDKDLKFDKSKKEIFITSNTFDRWGNPSWDDSLISDFTEFATLKDILVTAISDTYDFNYDIIDESIKASTNELSWILEADLEMIKIINDRDPDLIKFKLSEVTLDIKESDWSVLAMVQLEPYFESAEDKLALNALTSGRFHALASRKGFTRSKGFELFQDIMSKWKKDTSFEFYIETLGRLVEYKCLVEKLPEVEKVVVDIDDLLSHNKRGSQSWQFSRIRQVEKRLDEVGIDTRTYVYSDVVNTRIDEEDAFNAWIKANNAIMINEEKGSIPVVLKIAVKENAHYLGNKLIPKVKELKDLRIYSRQLRCKIVKNELRIDRLDIFYEWRMNNIFEEMYKVYY